MSIKEFLFPHEQQETCTINGTTYALPKGYRTEDGSIVNQSGEEVYCSNINKPYIIADNQKVIYLQPAT